MITPTQSPPEKQERLSTDLTTWVIGPYHGALPGPMRLKLRLDGEVIVSAETETGFLHRGLEKTFELHPWQSAVTYADRLDPEASIFAELAFCMAAEEVGSIEVPGRARAIRVILSELSRISSHLLFSAKVARSVGAGTMAHYALRDRERVLDLFELLSGARFSIGFLRFGGVAADVTEGFIERVIEVCDLLRLRLKEYNDLFTFNYAFRKRSQGIGTIDAARAGRVGLTGPNARAAGRAFDVRKVNPYSGYEKVDFQVPSTLVPSGDCHDRFVLRLREIAQSVEILRQVVEVVPAGPYSSMKFERALRLESGEAYARVESARGLLGCHVVSDGSEKPARVQFRVPSRAALALLPELLRGARMEDLPVILASMDIGVAEADR